MATLSGNQVKNTYQSLLKLESNNVSASLKTVEDGAGNDTALSISTSAVGVASLTFTTTPPQSTTAAEGLFLVNNKAETRTLGTSAFVDKLVLTASNGIKISGTYPNHNVEGFDSFSSLRANVGNVDATIYNESVNILGGTGISTTGDNATKTLTIVNDAPDQVVSFTGTDITIGGTYPNFTLTNDAPDQVVSITAGSDISVTGTYPSFTIINDAPDKTVSISGINGITVTGAYPSFTIDGSAVQGSGTSEEMFVGVPESPYTIGSNSSQILAFSQPDNSVETNSYHFGTAPAQLNLGAGGTSIENVSGQRLVIYVDMSAYVDVQSPNSDITYGLERFDGANWNKVKEVTRYKGFTGLQVDSFWGIFTLDSNESLRIVVSSNSGNVIFTEQSEIKFEVKETGNII